MTNYIIIDTCIFKELGFKFYENPDYINLLGFSIATESEVILSLVVAEEFSNHFKTEILKKQKAYNKTTKDLLREPLLKINPKTFVDIDNEVEKSIENFNQKIREDHNGVPITIIQPTLIDSLELTKFILECRNSGISNIQVRDYLIWDSVLHFAKKYGKTEITKIGRRIIKSEPSLITFITKDTGFQTQIFQDIRIKKGIENVEIMSSIPEYLHKRGFNLPFVTKELLLNKISLDRIYRDLSKDINSLLSYIIPITDQEYLDATTLSSKIEKVEIIEYYSYQEIEGAFKFSAHLKVWLDVKFLKKNYLLDTTNHYESYLQTFDSLGNPEFKAPVLFFYGGLLNIERKSIKSVKFVDFLPWVYI